jgi:uncharacterized protein YhfF
MRTAKTQTFWETFRRFEGLNSDAYAVTFFRTSPTVADDLLSLIVAGAKRATAGPMHYFGEGREEPLPIVGDYTVLLDRHRNPRLIWCTTQLSVAPLSSVTASYAWTDGDGGGEREAWLDVIRQSFTAQACRERFEMHDDIETLFETFEVIWPHATAQRLKRLDAHFQRGLQLLERRSGYRADRNRDPDYRPLYAPALREPGRTSAAASRGWLAPAARTGHASLPGRPTGIFIHRRWTQQQNGAGPTCPRRQAPLTLRDQAQRIGSTIPR